VCTNVSRHTHTLRAYIAYLMLTATEVAQYHSDGYVISSKFRLPPAELESIKARHARLVQTHGDSGAAFADYVPHLLPHDRGFLAVVRDHPELVAMVQQVIGEDVAIWNQSFFAKPAGTGRRVPWHQDGE